MSRLSDIQAVNARLAPADPTYKVNDRGQFYVEHYALARSEGALLEGHISTFSGTAGGNAFAANYLLADWGSNAAKTGAPFTYEQTGIYEFSLQIAKGFAGKAEADAQATGDGNVTIKEGIDEARVT